MGYTALYRNFRPKTFSEMVGQEHITRTLKNQIIANRVGHAYLLNGTRGTGKTSTAKILSRAINCLNPQNGEPCNECEICKSALAGSLTDIVEMDAASNNGVDDIRNIREEVNFLPTKAKYRVYIIDEVHMLSPGAFNALLKTLEEPPEHVKFILATTEPQKLPATILSRCQRFDFKKIPNKDIVKRLKIVCDESKFEYTENSLNLIAELSEGAMRDALSILERCVQDGENKISSEKIKELVGIPESTHIYGILNAIINKNVEQALEVTNKVLEEGKDLTNFIWEIIKYTRDVLVYKTSKIIEIYNEQEKEQIENLSKEVSKEKLIEIIYYLSEMEKELKFSTQKTIMFQAYIIKMCASVNPQITNKENLKAENVKQNIKPQHKEEPIAPKVNKEQQKNIIQKQTNTNIQKSAVQEKQQPKSKDFWPLVIKDLKSKGKIVLCTHLAGTKAKEINDMTVGIYFSKPINPFGKTVLDKLENKKIISDTVALKLGKVMEIKYIEPENSNQKNKANNPNDEIQKIAESNNIPFNIID